MIYISSSVNDLQGFRFQFCFWILHTCMINTYESMWERIQRNQFIIQFLYQWKKFTKDKLRFIIYVKTTSKKYLLYRMGDALANKLRIRSQLCREFLAEFLGTFILIVSWLLFYVYGYSYKGIVLFVYFCTLISAHLMNVGIWWWFSGPVRFKQRRTRIRPFHSLVVGRWCYDGSICIWRSLG